MPDSNPLHATSVMIDGRVLLLAGRAGRGKSDLALRLIDRGALLVSDDYTELACRDGILYARPPSTIAGKIEIRGVGISETAFADEGAVGLMLNLDGIPARLPEEKLPTTLLCGVAIPTLAFSAFEISAAIKAEQALRRHGLGAAS
jgi:hypothetical protein